MHRPTKMHPVLFGLACGLLAGVLPSAAGAQDAMLEEIVVTARKKVESLQDAPISITVFTEQELERRAINDLSEIAPFAPNLQIDTAVPLSAANIHSAIFIRGIGQNDAQLAVDPGVGIYVDGVYMSRTVGQIMELVDIERVEVLRGPQGTLFGRNTVGGAINITSRRPGETLDIRANIETGRDWDTRVHASVMGPISDQLRAGASIFYRHRDNIVDGVGPNAPDLGKRNSLAGRLMLDADISDTMRARFTFDGTRNREPSGSNVLIDYLPGSGFGEAHNFFFSGAPEICGNPASPSFLTDPRCFNQQWVLGRFESGATFETTEARQAIITEELGIDSEPRSDLDLFGISMDLEWDITDSITLRSISAFRSTDAEFMIDSDHSPHVIVHVIDTWDTEQFTQEVQLTGTSFADRLNWILGFYYFHENGDNISVIDGSVVMFRSGSIIDTDSYALFGQATWDITDRLSLTAGLRWTDETKEFDAGDQFRVLADFGVGIPAGTPLIPPGAVAETDYSEVNPMVSVNYRWTDAFSTYASFSQGLKGGGFTQNIFPPLPAIPTFDPEQLDNYEIGFKYFGLNNRLRINGAGFFGDYSDVQVIVIEGVAPTIRNAAGGEIKGGELEMEAVLTEAVRLQAGIGYLDAKFTEVAGEAALVGLTEDDRFVNAPKWTVSAGLSYAAELDTLGTLTPRLDWSYRTKVYNDAINTESLSQDAFHLINLMVNFEPPESRWTFTAGVRNVTDEEYLITGYTDPSGIGITEAVFDRGRRWFVSLGARF